MSPLDLPGYLATSDLQDIFMAFFSQYPLHFSLLLNVTLNNFLYPFAGHTGTLPTSDNPNKNQV